MAAPLTVVVASEEGAEGAGQAAADLRSAGVERVAVFVGDDPAAVVELLGELRPR